MKRLILQLLCMLILSIVAHAQSYYYWYQGNKISLVKDYNAFVIKTAGSSLSRQHLSSLLKTNDSTLASRPANIFLWQKQKGTDINPAVHAEKSITYFGNGFRTPSGDLMNVLPQICVQPKDSIGIAEVSAAFAEQITGSSVTKYGMVLLECSATSPDEVLDLSNHIMESGLVEWSQPNAYMDIRTTYEFPKTAQPDLIPNENNAPGLFANQYYLRNTGQMGKQVGVDIAVEHAWDLTAGASVFVAVIDEGCEAHEDLAGRVLGGFTAGVPGGTGLPQNGAKPHGMACAGIIGASYNNNLGIAGINPNARIIPINIFPFAIVGGGSGSASLADIAAAINWAWDDGHAEILSNSWGMNAPDNVIGQALTNAMTQGRNGLGSIVIASSGNINGGGAVQFPANMNNVITVGAINPGAAGSPLWNFSCTGASMDLVAPSSLTDWGGDIRTLDRMNANGLVAGNYMNVFGGTSASAPQVAGVAALMLSVNPFAPSATVRSILQTTATDMGAAGFDNNFGFGRVHACRAVLQSITTFTGPASFCGSGIYELLGVRGAAITWTVSGPAIIGNTNHSNPVLINKTAGNGTVTLTATVVEDCGTRVFTRQITAGTVPPVATVLGVAPFPNGPMDVKVTTTIPPPYKWYVDNVLVQTTANVQTTINGGSCGSHFVRVDAIGACGLVSSANVGYTRNCGMFAIAPNPTTDEVVMTFEEEENGQAAKSQSGTPRNVAVVDMQGTVHRQWQVNRANKQTRLNLSGLKAGTYIIKVTTGGSTSSATIIKK